jgi:hypothetical protein
LLIRFPWLDNPSHNIIINIGFIAYYHVGVIEIVEAIMYKKIIVGLGLVSLLLTSCTLPGSKKTPETGTPTPVVVSELPTSTIQSTDTPETVETDTPVLPMPVSTDTPERPAIPSPTPFPVEWYIIQPGTPLATLNTPHEEAGCSWLGVGGQVFNADTTPMIGLSILVGGTLSGHQVGSLGTTGMETNIGEGGFEVTLADHPLESYGTLWIQVVDTIGNPLSDKYYFDSYNDCARNFILINFVRYVPPLPLGSGWPAYLPLIAKRAGIINTPVP